MLLILTISLYTISIISLFYLSLISRTFYENIIIVIVLCVHVFYKRHIQLLVLSGKQILFSKENFRFLSDYYVLVYFV